jgi:calcineurin-like phosphoesterase family protein
MSRIFFTADTHFGHRKAIGFENRAFESVEEMDEKLIENWNEAVGRGDTIYHLGDLSFSNAERTIEIVRRLNGQKHWIVGNHDKALAKKPDLARLFNTVGPLKEIKVDDPDARAGGKQRIIMCHFPLLTWNCAHYGAWMLHGHSHGHMRYPVSMRIMDVGVDPNWLAPVSYENVKRFMADKEYVALDQHQERS